jgi:hypothetical protein
MKWGRCNMTCEIEVNVKGRQGMEKGNRGTQSNTYIYNYGHACSAHLYQVQDLMFSQLWL